MSIPLVQEATKDAINTSIIAIKRNIERINMLLGLSNSEEIDTSKFATKEELQQAVTDLQPVDEVALNNMQSVTSNAVAEEIEDTHSYSTTEQLTGGKWIDGKPIYRKVFYYSNITSNSFEINIGANIETFIGYSGSLKVSDIIRPFPYLDPTSSMKVCISSINSNTIYFYSAWGYGKDFIFMMEYTKTTDNAA